MSAQLRLPPAVVRASLRVAARWAWSPRIDWPTSRRRTELALLFPAPRGTRVRRMTVAGVPAEELTPPGQVDDALLVYLHGGGYAVGSPRGWRSLAGRMALGFGARALVLDYRLGPEHPHPAPLQDARSVWAELLRAPGADPGRIVVAGDSAGGGLTLALAQSLRDDGGPLPGALGLISPWLDLTGDVAGTRPPEPRDAALPPGISKAFASAFLAGGARADDPSVSPLLGSQAGLPPMIVHTSTQERIRADGERLVSRARAAGVMVIHEELVGYWHDPHTVALLLPEPVRSAPVRMAAGLRALIT